MLTKERKKFLTKALSKRKCYGDYSLNYMWNDGQYIFACDGSRLHVVPSNDPNVGYLDNPDSATGQYVNVEPIINMPIDKFSIRTTTEISRKNKKLILEYLKNSGEYVKIFVGGGQILVDNSLKIKARSIGAILDETGSWDENAPGTHEFFIKSKYLRQAMDIAGGLEFYLKNDRNFIKIMSYLGFACISIFPELPKKF